MQAVCCMLATDCFLKSEVYKQVGSDPGLYNIKFVKQSNGKIDIVLLSLQVDDMLLFSNEIARFDFEDLGEVNCVQGMLVKCGQKSKTPVCTPM